MQQNTCAPQPSTSFGGVGCETTPVHHPTAQRDLVILHGGLQCSANTAAADPMKELMLQMWVKQLASGLHQNKDVVAVWSVLAA